MRTRGKKERGKKKNRDAGKKVPEGRVEKYSCKLKHKETQRVQLGWSQRRKKRKIERWWRGKEVEVESQGRSERSETFGGYVCISMVLSTRSGGYYLPAEKGKREETGGTTRRPVSQSVSQSVSQAWRQAWGWIYTLRSGNHNLTLGNSKGTIGSLRVEGKV